jgi:hypothetical protein
VSTLGSVILQDVLANRPAPSIPGRLFLANDQQTIYRDNGAAWVLVSLFAPQFSVNGVVNNAQTGLSLFSGENIALAVSGDAVTISATTGGGGGGGASDTVALTATQTISAFTCVSSAGGIVPASSSTTSQMGSILGLAINSAQTGQVVTVQTAGEVTYNGWAWTAGAPLFLAANGTLTATPPASGFLQVIAVAIAPTVVLVRPEMPILIQ